jgi:hypothetical protein
LGFVDKPLRGLSNPRNRVHTLNFSSPFAPAFPSPLAGEGAPAGADEGEPRDGAYLFLAANGVPVAKIFYS